MIPVSQRSYVFYQKNTNLLYILCLLLYFYLDIVEEITSELTIPEEILAFNFATYNPKAEKQDDDLWSPKKLTPYVGFHSEDSYIQPKYPNSKPMETFLMTVPLIRITFEIEHTVRVPVLMVKVCWHSSVFIVYE